MDQHVVTPILSCETPLGVGLKTAPALPSYRTGSVRPLTCLDAEGTFTVTDTLPAGLTLQTPVSSASGTGPALDCSASTASQLSCSATGTVTWNQGAAKQINLTVDVAAEAAGETVNTATIAFTPTVGTPGDSVDSNNRSTDAAIVDVGTPGSIGIPPAGSRGIIAFPGRDFVSGTGYDPTDRVTVQVLRDSGSGYQIIAQSRVQQPGADGILEINHPGGGCWSGDPQHLTGNPAAAFPYTPDMRPGDVAKGTSAPCTAVADPGTGPTPSFPTNARPELTIDSTHADPFVVGTPNTYTLNVANVGNAPANANPFTPIKVMDYLPAGIGFVATTSTDWTCSATGQVVTCDRTASIAAGTTVSLVLRVAVGNAAVPSATNTATVSAPRDLEAPNSRDSDDTIVNPFVAPSPDLTIQMSHDRRFTVGITDNSYLVKVVNGLGPATPGPTTSAIQVVDTLPTGLTYNPDGSGGVNWTCAAVGQVVTCDYAGAPLADDDATSGLRLFVNVAAGALAGDPVTTTVNNSVTVSTAGGEELVSTRPDITATDTTEVRNNPSPPDTISMLAFPSRDFVSISGFDMGPDLNDPTDGDGRIRVELWRNGVLISQSGLMAPTDDPTTPGADGIVDINHVGGADCWTGVTPDVRPGDVVRSVDGCGVSYQITVLNARTDAAQAIDTNNDGNNDTVVAHGIATDLAGNRLSDAAFSNLEGRIISSGPLFAINGKRDVCTGGGGVLSREAGSIGFTATYTFGEAAAADIATALAGETRIHSSPNLLALKDVTIFETSPATFGGPAVAGCAPAEAPTADLGVTINAPGGAANAAQTATVTVTNVGPSNSVNTVVTLDLPEGVTSVTSADPLSVVSVSGRIAIVSIPSVTNVPVTITVGYTPTTAGTHVLAASTQSDSADANPITPGADMAAARITVT